MIKKILGGSLGAVLFTVGAGVAGTLPAATAAVPLYLPYTAGTTESITQYPHSANVYMQYAVDFGMNTGESVLASAPGIVRVAGSVNNPDYGTNGNQVVIDHGGNFCTLYNHLSTVNVQVGQSVGQAALLGGAGATGQATGAHLHWDTIDCATKYSLPKTGTVEYPSFAGFGNGTQLTSQNRAAAASLQPRIAVSDASGNISVKEGDILAPEWKLIQSGASSFSLAGDRIGVTLPSGEARVKDGVLGSTWQTVDHMSKSIVVTPERIGILRTNGEVWVKDQGISGGWTVVATNAVDFAMYGNRIGVVFTDGWAKVKEGSLTANFQPMLQGVTKIQVDEQRVAVLGSDGNLFAKEGTLAASWWSMASGVTSFHISGNRVGVVSNGTAFTKEGSLAANWQQHLSGVREVRVTSTRIVVVGNDGNAYGKQGSQSADWHLLKTGVGSARLSN